MTCTTQYIQILRDIAGHDKSTCAIILEHPDNGDLLQFLSMVAERKYPHLEYAIKSAIRWEAKLILKHSHPGRENGGHN